MPVIVGLGIVKGAPDRAGAAALIAHLERPDIQITTAVEAGFFPVVEAGLPADLSLGIKLLAEGVVKTQTAKDALVVLLPVGLGEKGGEFNKIFTDTFQRIVLRGEPVRAAIDAEATVMRNIIGTTKAPCWAPDKSSNGPRPVK
jgi:multiple sugar transport system substrate-binding protein